MDSVRAAGGVVWRANGDGVEVLIVHRPRYDDWSLPKGKLEAGETEEHAARREVEEETGLRCHVGDEVGSVDYVDHRGRPKVVRYWSMTPAPDADSGDFVGNQEVDAVQWLPLADARTAVSYDRDRRILDEFAAHR